MTYVHIHTCINIQICIETHTCIDLYINIYRYAALKTGPYVEFPTKPAPSGHLKLLPLALAMFCLRRRLLSCWVLLLPLHQQLQLFSFPVLFISMFFLCVGSTICPLGNSPLLSSLRSPSPASTKVDRPSSPQHRELQFATCQCALIQPWSGWCLLAEPGE